MGQFKEGLRIYNLFPRLVGAIPKWLEHCRRAKEMGFNWIFINPISLTGFSGSLYAIKDHYRLNPLFFQKRDSDGREEISSFMAGCRKMGLKLMIDLVINHTAFDSILTEEHPDWFKKNVDGTIQHPYCFDPPGSDNIVVWDDLAEIDNHSSPDRDNLWKYWLELVEHYINSGWDGFRCDAAYQVPADLWQEIITRSKAEKADVLFAAETLGCTNEQTLSTASCGFDYIFNNSKWWDMTSPWLLNQYNMTREIADSISFSESHDTTRLASDSHGKTSVSKMRYLFSAVYSTGVMVPIGYEFGFRKKLDVLWTSPPNWEAPSFDISDFIRKVNAMKASWRVFNEEGPQEILKGFGDNILFMKKSTNDGKESALIAINRTAKTEADLSVKSVSGLLNTNTAPVDVSPEGPMESVPDHLDLKIGPLQAKILVCPEA